MLVLSILVLSIWLYLLFFHAQFWRVDRLHLPESATRDARRVAVVIPARDEADVIGRAVGSLLRQDFTGEIRLFVVDDNSSDGTANAARAAAGSLGLAEKLVVISGSALPAGWTGKVWAMQQGWQAARTFQPDFVLLTDADVEHGPDNLARLITQLELGSFDLASVMVRLRCHTVAEKFAIPAFVYFFFLLYPPGRVANPRSRAAGAAGGCVLICPETLEKAGGFESIRGEIIDDCSLAARVKKAGGRLWLGVSQNTRSIRGYTTLSSLRDMISRTAFNQLRHSWLLLIACVAGMLLTFVAPLAMVWAKNRTAGWIAATACLVMFASYVPVLRLYKVNPLSAVTLPFAAIFYMSATVHSAVNYWRGKGGGWKGRAQDLPSSS
ncbi:MAG TPA: glycosyltransferase [Terriglobales bacterium]|nr:glycosyltransferase [Terriglobales bacterium]